MRLRDGRVVFSHGPDPRVPQAPQNHGTGFNIGDPERPLVCASDHYQHVLYGRPAGAPDRYAAVKAKIQASMRRADAVLNEDSLETGGVSADYKVLCEAGGQPRVDSFVNPEPFSFESIVDAAQAAGFTDETTNYTIFYDENDPTGQACGRGNVDGDESPSFGNKNNQGGKYAVIYGEDPCWYDRTPMHEIGHNLGAVQYNAPNSTGDGWHCLDQIDVMCYSDGGDRDTGEFIRCTDSQHFDCGHDDYFTTAPEPSGYLDAHWNVGSPLNRFLAIGDGGAEPGRLEAEAASISGGAAVGSNHGGYSGPGFVDGYSAPGANTSFNVHSETGGPATLSLRYANATGGDGQSRTRTLGLYVNGSRVRQIGLPPTGSWDTWSTRTESVNLNFGANTIEYRYDGGDSGNVNLDWLQVRDLASVQVEEGKLLGGTKPRTSHTGFFGRGFVAGFEANGASTVLTISADHSGAAQLSLRYANGVGSDGLLTDRTLGLYINGSRVRQIVLPPTGSWDTWFSQTENVNLQGGANTIAFKREVGDSGKVNLDRVALFQLPPTPRIIGTTPGSPSNDDNPKVRGTLGGGSPAQIKLYRNANCSGAAHATGTAAQFVGGGIALHVASNATTAISARATDVAGNDSGCSNSLNFTEDSTPPPRPTLTGSNPRSPANDNYPWLVGSAPGAVSVSVFEGSDCSGPPIATDTPGTFASPGIAVSVDDDTITDLSVSARDTAGNASACAADTITYVEDSWAPIISVRGSRRQRLRKGRVTITGDCDEDCRLSPRFQVLLYSHGRKRVLARYKGTPLRITSGVGFNSWLRPPKSIIRRLKHLRRGERIVVRFALNAADPAGNVGSTEYLVQLRR
ncbi:MAG: hypothetical protein QOH76_2341 [Thermoleophilaceae bacterium]|jgi:hypothetical protein|nr:hypothetical protein [Thermoleophilaceae bacterium]